MSSSDRQNRLLVAEDWQRIYRTFRNADFQSYDFENLRRTMIDYLRLNYPEDFNDYIESSEYLALIDTIAFLGQSIAFRADLNARDNFLELAERRDSVLRLARTLSYNTKRNIPAHGLLKFTTVSTTQAIADSNGRNLSGQVITWNDPSNTNWRDQFIRVMNAAMSKYQQFGSPSDRATVYGIPTEQYRLESTNADVPVFSFSKAVAGKTMSFELTSTTFSGQDYIYEEAPKAGNKLAVVYRNDGKGEASPNTGFFMNLVQGVLNTGTFTITQPSSNESVDIDAENINNTDVWLYKLDQNGNEADLWTKVPSFEGNNVIYNSISKNIRNIYGVVTKASDAVSLMFSDGTFGNKPIGTFRVFYRVSNGLEYIVTPQDIRNVTINIPYTSVLGQEETLTVTLGLASSITNASASETNESVKANAPATYYTQNRMITAEDYNISPLGVSQQVAKVKSVNRTSSGISRYFDLSDPTGKYSSTNLFATDGILYSEEFLDSSEFSYASKSDIEYIVKNRVTSIISSPETKNFFYKNFGIDIASSINTSWVQVASDSNSSSGYISDAASMIYKTGTYTVNNLKYFKMGALVKFRAKDASGNTLYFDTLNNNRLITDSTIEGAVDYIWTEVVQVVNDGTAAGNGVTSTGQAPITLNRVIPSTAYIDQIIPQWKTTIDSAVSTTITDLVFANKPFGLRYDINSQSWQIIFESNLNLSNQFSLGKQGDTTNSQQDSSWILLFTTNNEYYTIHNRQLRYVFESDAELSFYFNSTDRIYDSQSSSLVKDQIVILNVNKQSDSLLPYTTDLVWDVVSEYTGLDGYVDPKKVVVSFADTDNNGTADNPQLFDKIVNPSINSLTKFIAQERYEITTGQEDYRYSNAIETGAIIILPTKPSVIDVQWKVGQYFYVVDIQTVFLLNIENQLIPSLDYKVFQGRAELKFQYKHNADYDSRIDPGASNIMDIFVLTRTYDTEFRKWLSDSTLDQPKAPSSNELYNLLAPDLNLIKSVSDEIVFHPVSYKILFGPTANENLQAKFKVIKSQGQVISDNDVKSRVITAINEFFALENWDFGDTFYFSELAAYVVKQLAPNISNFVIVPVKSNLSFGSLFEIKSLDNQLFVSGATVNDVEIIPGITPTNIKSINSSIENTVTSQQAVTSSIYGSL